MSSSSFFFGVIVIQRMVASGRRRPVVALGVVFQSMEQALLDVGKAGREPGDEGFGARPFGIVAVATAVLKSLHAQVLQFVDDLTFRQVDHGTDEPHVGAVVPKFRLKAAKASVAQNVHQRRFHDVVEIVSQSDFVASQPTGFGVENSAAQVGAQRAGGMG